MTIQAEEIGYAEDDSCGGYDWGLYRVLTAEGRVWLVSESGCSCNGPESNWSTYDKVPDWSFGSLLELAEHQLKQDMYGHERVAACAILSAIVRSLKAAQENHESD